MNKCVKCKEDFTEEPHVVDRDIGTESTRKRYPTMKVCDSCFKEGYNAGTRILNKMEGAEPDNLLDNLLDDIQVNVPVDVYVDPAFINSKDVESKMVVVNRETREIIPDSVLYEVMIRDLPNFEIERKCTRCGKWFDVTVSTNRGDMRVSTQLCPRCKHNNQIYLRIKRIDDIEKLRKNAKSLS